MMERYLPFVIVALVAMLLSEQRQNNQPVISSNFRMDVNASNNVDSADVTFTQRQDQKRLP